MSHRTRMICFYWLPLLGWVGAIFTISLIPFESLWTSTVDGAPPSPGVMHTVAFFLLFLLIYNLLRQLRPAWPSTFLLSFCLVFTILVSITKEICQWPLAERSFSLGDLSVDFMATLAGVAVAWLWEHVW